MLTLQALSSSLNAGAAKGGCLGRGERLLGALRQSVPQNGRDHLHIIEKGALHKVFVRDIPGPGQEYPRVGIPDGPRIIEEYPAQTPFHLEGVSSVLTLRVRPTHMRWHLLCLLPTVLHGEILHDGNIVKTLSAG